LGHDVSVEALITANNIDDPNLLSVGQELVIPSPAPTPDSPLTEAATAEMQQEDTPPPPTATPIAPPIVEIVDVSDAGSLSTERVRVRNRGGFASLRGWTLTDADGNTYTLPNLTLFTDAEVTIYTRSGVDTPRTLHWGRDEPVWHSGELATLRDDVGGAVNTFIVH
jgi:LysM repeat protein